MSSSKLVRPPRLLGFGGRPYNFFDRDSLPRNLSSVLVSLPCFCTRRPPLPPPRLLFATLPFLVSFRFPPPTSLVFTHFSALLLCPSTPFSPRWLSCVYYLFHLLILHSVRHYFRLHHYPVPCPHGASILARHSSLLSCFTIHVVMSFHPMLFL